jgi:hypothetical protein
MERSEQFSEHGMSGSMDPKDSVRSDTGELSGDRELPVRTLRADAPPGGIERRRAERRRIERLSTDL